jgi:PPOX class probable F420-dependent enzyme
MASILDLTKEHDLHIDQRLRDNIILWLNTVRPDGRPHVVAVWFLWDGETILIFSRPQTQKIRNLHQHADVVLAVDDTKRGDDPITIEGLATLLATGEVTLTFDAYVEKYGDLIKELGYTPETMATVFSQPIRIRLQRVVRVADA